MKRNIYIALFVCCIFGPITSWAGYDEGMAAFDKYDFVTARNEFQLLADQRHAPSQYYLASLYFNGWGVEQNEVEGLKWLKNAAENGEKDAQYDLAGAYEYGMYGIEINHSVALNWYVKSADQGNSDAQWMLGNWYSRGYVVEKNITKAVALSGKSAAQGHEMAKSAIYNLAMNDNSPEAQNHLGIVFQEGLWGKQKNYKEAVIWYSKSAAQGDNLAQIFLFNLASGGNLEAQKSLLKFATEGKLFALIKLGMMYEGGMGVPINHPKAASFYIKAAEKGHPDAQYKVGVIYENGIAGKAINIANAVKWYKKAAKQGQTLAQERLDALL